MKEQKVLLCVNIYLYIYKQYNFRGHLYIILT